MYDKYTGRYIMIEWGGKVRCNTRTGKVRFYSAAKNQTSEGPTEQPTNHRWQILKRRHKRRKWGWGQLGDDDLQQLILGVQSNHFYIYVQRCTETKWFLISWFCRRKYWTDEVLQERLFPIIKFVKGWTLYLKQPLVNG